MIKMLTRMVVALSLFASTAYADEEYNIGIISYDQLMSLKEKQRLFYIDGLRSVMEVLEQESNPTAERTRAPASAGKTVCVNGGFARVSQSENCPLVSCREVRPSYKAAPGTVEMHACQPIIFGSDLCVTPPPQGGSTINRLCRDAAGENFRKSAIRAQQNPQAWNELIAQYKAVCTPPLATIRDKQKCWAGQDSINRVNVAAGFPPAPVFATKPEEASVVTPAPATATPVRPVTATVPRIAGSPSAERPTAVASQGVVADLPSPGVTSAPRPAALPPQPVRPTPTAAEPQAKAASAATGVSSTCNLARAIEQVKCDQYATEAKSALTFTEAYNIFCVQKSITAEQESQVRERISRISSCLQSTKSKALSSSKNDRYERGRTADAIEALNRNIKANAERCIAELKAGRAPSSVKKATIRKEGGIVTIRPSDPNYRAPNGNAYPATVTAEGWTGMTLTVMGMNVCDLTPSGYDGIRSGSSTGTAAPAAAPSGPRGTSGGSRGRK